MKLESRNRPHVVDTFFDRFVQSEALVGTGDQNHNFFRIHDSANADSQSLFRNFFEVVVEESGVCLQSVLGKSLHTSSRSQR